MSLIEIGETGSWFARFFPKTVGSYAKKTAKPYYLSSFFGYSVLLQTTPSHFHCILINYCPSLPYVESALWKAAVHCSLDLVLYVHMLQNSWDNHALTSGVELYTVSEFSEATSSAVKQRGYYLISPYLYKPKKCCSTCFKDQFGLFSHLTWFSYSTTSVQSAGWHSSCHQPDTYSHFQKNALQYLLRGVKSDRRYLEKTNSPILKNSTISTHLLTPSWVELGSSVHYLFPPLQFLEEWSLLLLLLHSPLLQKGEKVVNTFTYLTNINHKKQTKKNQHCSVEENKLGKQFHELLLPSSFLENRSTIWNKPIIDTSF